MDDLTKLDDTSELCGPGSNRALQGQHKNTKSLNRNPIDFSLRSLSQDGFESVDSQRLNLVRTSLSASTKPDSQRSGFRDKIACWKNTIIRKVTRQKSVEILRVMNTCQIDLKTFQWGWLNPPMQNTEFLGFSIPIGGWIVGREAQPSSIRIFCGEELLAETPIDIPRPDVVKAHFFQGVTNCGYSTSLDLAKLANNAEIVLVAVFPNGHMATVGSIQFRKYT